MLSYPISEVSSVTFWVIDVSGGDLFATMSNSMRKEPNCAGNEKYHLFRPPIALDFNHCKIGSQYCDDSSVYMCVHRNVIC